MSESRIVHALDTGRSSPEKKLLSPYPPTLVFPLLSKFNAALREREGFGNTAAKKERLSDQRPNVKNKVSDDEFISFSKF